MNMKIVQEENLEDSPLYRERVAETLKSTLKFAQRRTSGVFERRRKKDFFVR